MAPTPPNVNLTAAGAGSDSAAAAAAAAPAAPAAPPAPPAPGYGAYHFGAHYLPPGAVAPPMPGTVHHRARPHAERDAYPDTYPGQYEFNLPPVHRKPLPPVPPYPGTEHLYNNYPVDTMLVKEVPLPPGGPPGPGVPAGGAAIVVRAEEALLVLLVLVLWVAAIALFFNRWGKIRMLEPYQPKFQQHRQSCALVDISGTTQSPSAVRFRRMSSKQRPADFGDCRSDSVQHPHRLSKFNLHSLGEPVMLTGPPGPAARAQLLRPRQNSVFVGASPTMLTALHNPPRKVKSAMDLQTLVLSEHEPGMGAMGPIGGASSASMLPTMTSMTSASMVSPSMRRASHVPVGSVPLGAIRHHASFSHASFSEQPSCSHHHHTLRAPGYGMASGVSSGMASTVAVAGPSSERAERAAERLASMDRYSHGSNV